MLDVLVGFLLVGLALMGLLQLVAGLFKLRYRNLREALVRLVEASKPPKGFLSHVLVERALADPKIDPLSPGLPKGDVRTPASGRVSRVEAGEFVRAARTALEKTDVKVLVDGLSVRPEAVQLEVRQEVAGLGDRIAASAATDYDRVMQSAAQGYAKVMRWLTVLLGVPAAVGLVGACDEGLPKFLAPVLAAIGVFVVPIAAQMWYGLLAGPMKLRPETQSSRSSRSSPPRGRAGRGGKGGRDSRSAPSKPNGAEGGAGGSGGGGRSGSRRRGRRSSGRRGGGRPGGGKPAGENSGGGGPDS